MQMTTQIRDGTLAEGLGPGHRVATLQVDSGLKYLGGATYR